MAAVGAAGPAPKDLQTRTTQHLLKLLLPAAGAKAMDRSDPGHAQYGSPERESGAIDVQLTLADLRETEAAFSRIKVHGGRMSEKYMRDLDLMV